jgi:hypothetical protein
LSEVAVRDEGGKFLEGVSGNPAGRPPGTRNKLVSAKRKLEIAVREGMSADKLKRIIDKMAALALDGDTKAARLILDKFISSATDAEDSDDKGHESRGITIRIENATFAKTNQPIDVQFQEIKENGSN